jgi:sugar phosphate isomerase/epimerase
MGKVSFSTLPFLDKSPSEVMDVFIASGVEKAEIFMEGSFFQNTSEESLKKIATQLREYPLGYSVHPPMYDVNLASGNESIRQNSLREYQRALTFARELRASHIVVDPGVVHLPVFNKSEAIERARKSILELLLHAERYSVVLGIENIGHQGKELFSQEEYKEFVSSFDHTLIQCVIDTGHAHLNRWNLAQLFQEVVGRVVAVHVNDNTGRLDNHLPIGEGTINWAELFSAWKRYEKVPDLVLEYNIKTEIEQMLEHKVMIEQKLLN